MMNATVEKLVKAVEGRMAPKGYVVSFAETKKNSGMNKDDISQMIQEVNSQQVDEQERLSDHAYFYKRGSLQITF